MTNAVTVTAPANIAFLKYWGKKDPQAQIPANDSLSMTLTQACTTTTVRVSDALDHQVVWQGTPMARSSSAFHKAYAHLDRLEKAVGGTTKLAVWTANSFPASCGIASSASGIAALTVAAAAAWLGAASLEDLAAGGWPLHRLADAARLGSGSACRSLYPGIVQWSVTPIEPKEGGLKGAHQPPGQIVQTLFGCDHWSLADTIVILDDAPKGVSSSAGHLRATSSPQFPQRLQDLPARKQAMLAALAAKDLARLGPLLEQEALEIHGIMESSIPPLVYRRPKTHAFLAWLRQLRHTTGLQAYATIDAGPNVHVITHRGDQQEFGTLLQSFPHAHQVLRDQIGAGVRFTSRPRSPGRGPRGCAPGRLFF